MKGMTLKTNKMKLSTLIALAVMTIMLVPLTGCKNKTYTVKFNSDGGTKVEDVKVKANQTVKKPTDPTKDGYIFDGWYYENEEFDFATKIKKDITLKAHWNDVGIQLADTELNMLVGNEKKLEIISLPDGLTEEDLVYSSSDESVVTVGDKGNLKAIKEGTATVTVKSKDEKHSATCNITVTTEQVDIESIKITGSSSVSVGSSIKLGVTFNPKNATISEITWSSSNEKIATVNNGSVTGKKEGTVTITAKTANGKTATKKITVKAKSTTAKKSSTSKNTKPSSSKKVVEATSVKITGPQEVYVKESIKLSATVSPSNTTNKTVTWKSSNTSIATVDKNGKVTGVKDGEITITAMTSNGKTATYKVTVKSRYQLTLKAIPVEGVEGTVYQYTFTVTKNGNAFTDYAGFEINGHGYRKVTSNPTVAAGHVSKGQNSATITLSNGEKKNLIVKIN